MKYLLTPFQLRTSLVFDIEVVPQYKTLEDLKEENPALAKNWKHEASKIRGYKRDPEITSKTDAELYDSNSALYPEFGKIVSISAGVFNEPDDSEDVEFWMKTITDDNEQVLLYDFAKFLHKLQKKRPDHGLIGWNSQGFDVPYVLKRYIINDYPIPKPFRVIGVKPWEDKNIDLADLYRINYNTKMVKMDLLASVFGIQSSKDELDGAGVRDLYYSDDQEKMIKIHEYCKADVLVTAKIARKFSGQDLNFTVKDL